MNTNYEKEFIPYEQALELKELGFNEPCIMQWTYAPDLIFCTNAWGHPKLKTNKESYSDSGGDCISAPTFSQAFRWFRKKNFICHVTNDLSNNLQDEVYVYVMTKGYGSLIDRSEEYSTYEEAELACLRKLIEIVKQQL